MDSKKLFISTFLFKQREDKKGNCPIMLRITLDQKRENINTGVSTSLSAWDAEKARIRGNSAEVEAQNKVLLNLKTKVLGIYADLLKDSAPISAAILKAKLQGQGDRKVTLVEAAKAHLVYVEKRVGIETTRATVTKYYTLNLKLASYLKAEYKRSDMLLAELNNAFAANFELYLKTNEGIGHNTTTKYVQFLKRVINYSISQGWVEHNPFSAYKCTFKTVHRQVLTIDEIRALETKEITILRLSIVRDIFVFCCYTGLAYSDVKKLTMDEIALGVDNGLWINTFRAKTNTRVSVPLLPMALRIVQQYHEWRIETSTTKVLPVLSNQKMNGYLKELADMCGLSLTLTFHIARHSFATSVALNNGVPIESVSKMLGHTNIKTTQIYAKVLDKKIAEDMGNLRERLE